MQLASAFAQPEENKERLAPYLEEAKPYSFTVDERASKKIQHEFGGWIHCCPGKRQRI